MFKLFAAAVLALAARAQDVEDNCCRLYSGPDYTGIEYEICLPQNFMGEQLPIYGFSFHTTGALHEMQDTLESYRCGALAGADFCFTETNKQWDKVTMFMVYSCNELAFSTDGLPNGGDENPGPLVWMNTISAVVLKAAEAPTEPPEPVDPEPVDPEPPVTNGPVCDTTFFQDSECGRVEENADLPQSQAAVLGLQGMPSFPFTVRSVRLDMMYKMKVYDTERFLGHQVIQSNLFPRDDDSDRCICFSLENEADELFEIKSYELIDLVQS